MLCKDCKYCKTKYVGCCGSSRSYCDISSGSIAKGTRLGVRPWLNKEHPKCPIIQKADKVE